MWEKISRYVPATLAPYLPWIALSALVAAAAYFGMGLSQAAVAHDAFHDLRHALGTPCH